MDQETFVAITNKYFKRFSFTEIELDFNPQTNPSLIVVIPAYNEENISQTINSLFFNQNEFSFEVEIIVLVNNSIDEEVSIVKTNKETMEFLDDFAVKNNTDKISLYSYYVKDLNPKHAGVGWARKIGMDLALKRFNKLDYNGIIVGLDADATVCSNYFNSIHYFFENSDFSAASIHFEHPISGNDYSELQYLYIQLYELHLRYYKNALSFTGFPYAFHTVGSSFAVKALAYARQGGMNRRKAGEDFYFINKIIKGEDFGEILDANVYPSPRVSNRVPFGTGRAILEAFNKDKNLYLTYDFKIFIELKKWVDKIKKQDFRYSNFPELIKSIFSEDDWLETHNEILCNSASQSSYLKRFFAKYDAFWTLKFVHFCRDNLYENSSLEKNINSLLKEINIDSRNSIKDNLLLFRDIDTKKGAKAP